MPSNTVHKLVSSSANSVCFSSLPASLNLSILSSTVHAYQTDCSTVIPKACVSKMAFLPERAFTSSSYLSLRQLFSSFLQKF